MAVAFILLNLLMIFSSVLAAGRISNNDSLSELITTGFLFYITQVILSILFFGSIVKNLEIFYLILFNSIISFIIIISLRKSIRAFFNQNLKHVLTFYNYILKSKDYFLYFFIVLFLFQAIILWIKVYFLPPLVGDVFSYHLHPVVDWFQQGRILSYTDTPVWRANDNPLGSKLIHLWFVIFFRNITWIEIQQFISGIILTISVYRLMVKMAIQKINALKYAILVYFIPIILLQSRTAQDHLLMGAFTFLALDYIVDLIFNERPAAILPLFISFGILAGIKKHSILIILVLFISIFLSRGFNGKRVLDFIKKNKLILSIGIMGTLGYSFYFFISKLKIYENIWIKYKPNFNFTLVLVVVSFLILSVLIILIKKRIPNRIKQWVLPAILSLIILFLGVILIKNWSLLHPFFMGNTSPTMVQNKNFENQYPKFTNSFIKNTLAFPFRVKDIGLYTPYTPDLLEISGFGIQFFAFGLIGYAGVLLLSFKQSYRNSIMGFLWLFSILLLGIYFCFYFSWANYRSFIFFGVIGIIAWAYILERIHLKSYFKIFLDILIVIMILFNGVTCFYEGNMSSAGWKTVFTLNNEMDRTSIKYSTLLNGSKSKENWNFIDRYIPAKQPIGYSSGAAAFVFPYFDNGMKRRIYYLNNLPGFNVVRVEKNNTFYNMLQFNGDFIESLKQRDIHFIHLNREATPVKDRLYISKEYENIYKLTSFLYYLKW